VILLHYRSPTGPRLAVRDGHETRDAGITLADALRGIKPKPGEVVDLANARLAPAVPQPGKIVCIGLNYRRHAAESGLQVPERPIVFAKLANTPAASSEDIPLPPVSTQYDYEAELVAVIGRTARNVPETGALDHVWGYCNGNDLSARDLQSQSSQWLLGKSLDHFAPMGPYLVSRDEAQPLEKMAIECTVNGDVRQSSMVADMVFGVQELISFVSRHFTLDPGDVIFTGTPEGVADGRPDHPWLKPGDEVVVEVGNLGRLVNRMVRSDS
jgi:2-keto-4-pentenoate hydratase/2-oxohepta-3-ene-1,7-dioic acid hydratase in catechol pathway